MAKGGPSRSAQDAARWCAILWSAEFQALSKTMTDGEVSSLIGACASIVQLERVISFMRAAGDGEESPFSVLSAEAASAHVELAQWIQDLAGDSEASSSPGVAGSVDGRSGRSK